MPITVYTKPECVQCTHTKKVLDSKGLEYNEIDVTTNAEAAKVVEATGDTRLPMVVVGDQVWHGFHVDKLRGLSASS